MSTKHSVMREKRRCVIVGGAGINDYSRIGGYLENDDYVIYCDSGLKHLPALQVKPDLIVGDFDSWQQPDTETETILMMILIWILRRLHCRLRRMTQIRYTQCVRE